MKILLFVAGLLCRRLMLEPKETFTFMSSVAKDMLYKLVYQSSRGAKIRVSVFSPENELMISTREPRTVLYSRMSSDGMVKVVVKNESRKPITFGYRCPDVNKEIQGALGPIKDVDQVVELQNVLENIIQTQRVHIKKHEQHAAMVAVSRKWVTRLLIFETAFFLGVLYFLHKDMLKMFETERSV